MMKVLQLPWSASWAYLRFIKEGSQWGIYTSSSSFHRWVSFRHCLSLIFFYLPPPLLLLARVSMDGVSMVVFLSFYMLWAILYQRSPSISDYGSEQDNYVLVLSILTLEHNILICFLMNFSLSLQGKGLRGWCENSVSPPRCIFGALRGWSLANPTNRVLRCVHNTT